MCYEAGNNIILLLYGCEAEYGCRLSGGVQRLRVVEETANFGGEELNRNYTHALEVLLENRLYVERILKVLVAHAFSYQVRGVYQYTPEEMVKHIQSS